MGSCSKTLMKNKILYLLLIFFSNFLIWSSANSIEQFNFNVTEVEILNNGNIVKGLKRGTINTNDGIFINADTFEFDKISNKLSASGNVELIDTVENYVIYSDNLVYFKNLEKIITKKNSKAIYEKNKVIIADRFEYNKFSNILNAKGNVKIEDKIKNNIIYSNNVTYYKDLEKIITKGKTSSFIQSKYEIKSEDIIFLINQQNLSSYKKTEVKDSKSNIYYLNKFNYQINDELLKGEDVLIVTNFNLPKSDKFYLKNAIIDLKNQNFLAKDTEVRIHKDIFKNSDNDPRLKGVSSMGNNDITLVNKGIFTSCGKNNKCPPWSIKAEKIIHNKKKRQLEYSNAFIRVYDFPILYLPKFFHPDPSVDRQSGFLRPQTKNSSILSTSLTVPYFKVLSENKDFTFTPTIFENDLLMFENEYRQVNKNSNFLLNFGYVDGYKSSLSNKKNSIFHIFSKLDLNLNLDNFISSNFLVSLERITNDTFLKVFDQNIQESDLKPDNSNTLVNQVDLSLSHENYNFNTGITVFENLQKNSSDRYQYIFPYYNFEKELSENFLNSTLNFISTGSNNLNNTNHLETSITNDLALSGPDFVTKLGLKSNFEIDIKNLNSIGKNSSIYKSSPQIELISMYHFNSSLPMIKRGLDYNNFFTPKLSLKINPHDMKNYSNSDKIINIKNIFNNNRLGLTDTLESGRSLTAGINYRKQNKNNLNNLFEANLATVFRDKEEEFIPKKTTLNKKNSNIFGNIKTNFNELITLNYNFSVNNNYDSIENSEFNTILNFGDLQTELNFIKKSGEMGDDSIFESKIIYNFDNSKNLKFNTRRNRKLNLTEYYNLVYEYNNDCLTAGIKYNKTYYEDRDLKPSEHLFFTITLIPLGEHEQKVKK